MPLSFPIVTLLAPNAEDFAVPLLLLPVQTSPLGGKLTAPERSLGLASSSQVPSVEVRVVVDDLGTVQP